MLWTYGKKQKKKLVLLSMGLMVWMVTMALKHTQHIMADSMEKLLHYDNGHLNPAIECTLAGDNGGKILMRSLRSLKNIQRPI